MMMDIETNFLYNSWYVAGWSSDFEHSLLRLRMLVRIANYRYRMDGCMLTGWNVDITV